MIDLRYPTSFEVSVSRANRLPYATLALMNASPEVDPVDSLLTLLRADPLPRSIHRCDI